MCFSLSLKAFRLYPLPPLTIKRDLLPAYLSLAGLCIIWGTTFLVMRIGVASFPPFLFAGIRQLMAGILLCSFLVIFRGAKLPSLRDLLHQAVAGFLMIAVGNGFVSWAEVYIPSGLAAIICSTMPLWVTLINIGILRVEKMNLVVMAGLILGLLGIVVIFSEHLGAFANAHYRTGIILTFVAALAWSVGSILIKRNKQKSDPFLNAGLQMLTGGFFCFLFSAAFDDLNHVVWTTPTLLALSYLIVVGSAVAFALYAYVLIKLPITIASLYSYVNPLVAVMLGWLVLSEKLNLKIGIAFVITVFGIYLVNRAYQKQKGNY